MILKLNMMLGGDEGSVEVSWSSIHDNDFNCIETRFGAKLDCWLLLLVVKSWQLADSDYIEVKSGGVELYFEIELI